MDDRATGPSRMKVRRSPKPRTLGARRLSATPLRPGGNLKQHLGFRGGMATERKFSRFNPIERAVTTSQIPEGGFCLSSFIVISQTGHPRSEEHTSELQSQF